MMVKDVSAMKGAVEYSGPLGAVKSFQVDSDGAIKDTDNDSVRIWREVEKRTKITSVPLFLARRSKRYENCCGDTIINKSSVV